MCGLTFKKNPSTLFWHSSQTCTDIESIQEELDKPRFKASRLQIMAFNSLLKDLS